MKLDEVPISDLWDEIERRGKEADRPPERTLLLHIARWEAVCTKAHVAGLLKIGFSCERIPGDEVRVSEEVTRLNVMWLHADMRTHDRRKPNSRRLFYVRFRQVVPIMETRKGRLGEIWKLTNEAYTHEAAELLRIGTRRIARTHANGSEDAGVVPP